MSDDHLGVRGPLAQIRATGVFRAPQFVDLRFDHVSFDSLTGRASVEEPLRQAVEAGESAAIVGISGAGKSSALAWLCGRLGAAFIPIRVPVADLASLDEEHRISRQPIDRLHGLDRLISICVHHGLTPVFVVEDTEAALGTGVSDAARDQFFASSLGLMVREIQAPTLIAVQPHFTELDAYRLRLRPSLLEVRIPRLSDPIASGISAILSRRLAHNDLDVSLEEVVDDDAIMLLAELYDDRAGSIRHVLAALDVAVAAALDSDATRLRISHVRLGIEEWRGR